MLQVSRIAFVGVLAVTGFATVEVAAQDTELFNDAALEADWWEGNKEFGADDSIGAIQRIDQEDILGAAKLIKQGKSATLGTCTASKRRSRSITHGN